MTPIQMVVTRYFQIGMKELCGDGKKSPVMFARHIAQYLERERGTPFAVIGAWYQRDHSSVLYAHRHVMERLAAKDHRYVTMVAEVQRRVLEYEATEQARQESRANMACVACGISVAELLEQIRKIHRRLDTLGVKP